MSWFSYRSKSGNAEGSYPDYVKGRPIISYDAARGTHSYVTRIEARPASHVMVDPSTEKYGRPREVEEFITKILDEVNGPPDSGTTLNPDPNRGRHSSPVKVYPTSDHGYDSFSVKSKIFGYHGDPNDYLDRPPRRVYDQPPHKEYDAPKNRYFDQSHGKSETSKDYEAPRKWERSYHPLYDSKDHRYPKNQWGNSSIEFRAPNDHEVPKRHWDKSSGHVYDDRFPKYQYAEMSKDHGGTNSPWHNYIAKPHSPNNQGFPSNDRLSSYDQPSLIGHGGGAPKNYGKFQSHDKHGLPGYQHERSSSPLHDHSPPNGYIAGVPNSKWGNSLMKPKSPKSHGAPNNQWGRSSSPIRDHSPPTKSASGFTGVPRNQWGNSLMNPQSPKGYRVSNNQWDSPSSPVYDHPPPTMSTGGKTGVPSTELSNSSMKPQRPKENGAVSNQWDRSSNPVHDRYPSTRNTGVALNAPTSRWGNSSMQPQPSNDSGVTSNQWNRSSSPVHDRPPLAKTSSESPIFRGNNSVKPISPKDHGAPNRSFVHDHQLPSKNKNGIPDNQWPSLPTMSQSQSPKDYGVSDNQGNKQSSFVHGDPPVSGSIGGVPNKRWSDHHATPQSPKGYNQQDRSSSPVHSHSQPTRDTTGIPNSRLVNSSMKPQSPKKANNPYDQKTGNNNNNINTHLSKPVGYAYDHQPEEYSGSNNWTKPNGYLNPHKMDTASATQKPLAPDNPPDPRLKFSYPSSVGPKHETKVGPGYVNNAEPAKRYDGQNFPAKPFSGNDLK